MIFRLSFPEGILLSQPTGVRLIIARYQDQVVRLEPGEYDLTPACWKDNACTYSLLVHSEGTAMLRATPCYSDVAVLGLFGGDRRVIEPLEFSIGRQQPTGVVAGLRCDGRHGVFEIIIYRPERTTAPF